MGAEKKRKRKAEFDEDDDDGPPPGYVITPPAWEAPPVAKQVQEILDAVEAPPVDKETRSTLQRYLWRRQRHGDLFRDEWGNDGRGYITLLLRTILESEGNGDSLIEPVVVAVSSCMRPIWVNRGLDWIAAFDQIPLVGTLNKLRDLDLFDKNELAHYYALSIRRRLWKLFGPDAAPEAPKVKQPPKQPRAVTRIPAIEKKIALGLQLLDLRSKAEGNIEFGRLRRKLGVEPVSAQEALRVARVYGQRPEIYRRLTWQALVEMASPSLSAEARADLEAKIMAGDRFSHTQIRVRRPLRSGGRAQGMAA
jgi:hypothetical protein